MSSKKNQMQQANMSMEEKLARAARVKRRFINLVKLVIENRYWLQDTTEVGLSNSVHKNIAVLRRKKHASLFTLKEKTILNTPMIYRTMEDKEHLWKIIESLRCFRRYPELVKRQLADSSGFQYVPPNRLILRQGEKVGHAMYVILSGSVRVTQEIMDPISNDMVSYDLGTLSLGYTFGEVGLLHGIPRTASVRTVSDCEFLVVTKENFDTVLRASVQKLWDEIKAAMKTFNFFQDWDDVTIRECCILSKMKTFHKTATILGDGFGSTYYVYFIVSGQCQIIEHLDLDVKNKNGLYPKYRISKVSKPDPVPNRDPSKQTITDAHMSDPSVLTISENIESGTLLKEPRIQKQVRKDKIVKESHYLQLCILLPGHCFNIGENLKHRRIVAKTEVVCMCIPRYLLMIRNYDNRWTQHMHFLDVRVPPRMHVLKNFIQEEKWKKFRKSLLEDAISKRSCIVNTTVHDVPYIIRMTNPLT